MRSLMAFTKKEFMESLRTYRFFILMTIFMLFGFLNPIIAKIMPEILSSVLPEGMTITLEEPTALDSWMQFFKNISQTGTIVLVVIFSGIVSNEISKGTLVIMLTKGLSRRAVILSKFISSSIQWTMAYVVCVLITYLYTIYFWSMDNIQNLGLALFSLWVFGLLLISMTIFGGLLFRSIYGALLFTGGLVLILTVLGIFPEISPFNPMTLSSKNVPLLTGDYLAKDMISAMIVGIFATITFITASVVDWMRLS